MGANEHEFFWPFITAYAILTSKAFWLVLGLSVLAGLIRPYMTELLILGGVILAGPLLSVLGDSFARHDTRLGPPM